MKPFTSPLDSVGRGPARVDTRLRTSVLIPGEVVQGHVSIRAGEAAQTIESIALSVTTGCTRNVDDASWMEMYTLASYRLSNFIQIGPGERMLLPFAFPLPYETPLTLGRQRICLHTTLGIAGAVDSKHSDILHIRPHPVQRQVLDAIAALGFQLTRVESRYQLLAGRAHPIVQGLEFLPARAHRQAVEQIEVIFDLREHELELLIEIDRRARSLGKQTATADELDERYVRMRVPCMGLDRVVLVEMVEQAIESVYSEVER